MLLPYVAGLPSLSFPRQDRPPLDRLAGTLRVEIERTQRLDLVSPPLEPRLCRHPNPIHVEDPAPYAELRHFRDRRDARVTHRLESLDDGCELQGRSLLRPYPLSQHQSHFSQRPRHPRALGGGARGRDQHANLPRQQQLQRLHALAGDLEVRLFGAQRLTLRVQRDRGPRQRPQVRKPPLRIGRRGCDHDKDALRESRSEEHTSELQSLAYLVCRLLLEKKKTQSETHTQRQLRSR